MLFFCFHLMYDIFSVKIWVYLIIIYFLIYLILIDGQLHYFCFILQHSLCTSCVTFLESIELELLGQNL